MRNGLTLGIAIGTILGALVVNNCSHVRNVVDDVQRKVKSKMHKANEVIMNTNNNSEYAADCDAQCCECCNSIPDEQ